MSQNSGNYNLQPSTETSSLKANAAGFKHPELRGGYNPDEDEEDKSMEVDRGILSTNQSFELPSTDPSPRRMQGGNRFFPEREDILYDGEWIKFRAWDDDPEKVVFAIRLFGQPFNLQRCECFQFICLVLLLSFLFTLFLCKWKIFFGFFLNFFSDYCWE